MKKTVAVLALTLLVACAPPAPVPQTLQTPPKAAAEPAAMPTGLTRAETAEPPLALVGYSAPRAAAPDADDAALVKELVEILNTTQTKDTFAVTAAALVFTRNSRQALPAVIRNGERLGAFEGLLRRLSSGN